MFRLKLLIIISIAIQCSALPMTRMRVCVQSNDPLRLASQCVFCNNRLFQPTVKQCTNQVYLPADLSVEEAFCMVSNCRRQMPLMRPEPYHGQNVITSVVPQPIQPPVNTDYDSDAIYSETSNHVASNNIGKRRPAPINVGKPIRPSAFNRPLGLLG